MLEVQRAINLIKGTLKCLMDKVNFIKSLKNDMTLIEGSQWP